MEAGESTSSAAASWYGFTFGVDESAMPKQKHKVHEEMHEKNKSRRLLHNS